MLNNVLLQNKKEINSEYLGEKIFNLADQTFQIPKDFQYQVIEVTKDYIGRMDLISKQIYGTSSYSDILCKINGISNPFELNESDRLIIPALDNIADFIYNETSAESDNEADPDKPKAKAKVDKRKPNEAIIGDKRYKVDKTNKVIIY